MKPSLSPISFIGNSSLTEQNIQDFLELTVQHMRNTTTQNKTNVLNDTSDLPGPHSNDCIGYCDSSQLRHIFKEYKHYHGYVSLVVSIFILSEMIAVNVFAMAAHTKNVNPENFINFGSLDNFSLEISVNCFSTFLRQWRMQSFEKYLVD